MRYLLALLLAALLVLSAGAFLLASGWGQEEAPPSSEPSRPAEGGALVPSLRLEGRLVRAGAVIRGRDAVPTDLTDIGGSATLQDVWTLPELRFGQQPDRVTATLSLRQEGSDTSVFTGTWEELKGYTPQEEGVYILDLWAGWDGTNGGFTGMSGYRLALIYELSDSDTSQPPAEEPASASSQPEGTSTPEAPSSAPEAPSSAQGEEAGGIRLTVDREEVPQGYCVLLRVSGLPEGVEEVTAVTDNGFTPTFYEYQGEMVALMPARYNWDTGEYHITVTAGEESRDFTMKVTDGGFHVTVQQITMDQSVADATVNSKEANETYEKVTRPLKNLGDPVKYWEGPFQMPIDAKYKVSSSTFGRIRIINGVKDQHAGIDYPAPQGEQVYAPNNGRVLYAGYLQLTGNTICIEHGFGLKSWYYHLSAVDVEADQMVKTGDPIGKVGSTGYSTGPHLHFTMSVNNIYTNPEQYLAEDILE